MINYKGDPFFVVPKEFSMRDMEFNIYDEGGRLIGTNVTGIYKSTYYTEDEIDELEELIQDFTLELEFNIKFLKEYGVEINNWNYLDEPKEVIINSMLNKWNISENIINKYLKY